MLHSSAAPVAEGVAPPNAKVDALLPPALHLLSKCLNYFVQTKKFRSIILCCLYRMVFLLQSIKRIIIPSIKGTSLASFKSAVSVQALPFQDSEFANNVGVALPPATIVDVVVPTLPTKFLLTVFISVVSDQEVPLKVSVFPTFVVVYPPITIDNVDGPPEHPNLLGVFKSPFSAQDDPFHCSANPVLPPGFSPPAIIAAVLLSPEPNPACLALLTSVVSVQADPFQDSTLVIFGTPVEAKADVVVPAPIGKFLAVFMETLVLQEANRFVFDTYLLDRFYYTIAVPLSGYQGLLYNPEL